MHGEGDRGGKERTGKRINAVMEPVSGESSLGRRLGGNKGLLISVMAHLLF